MRVGIATAKAMAHALRVPVIPVASLDLLALPLRYADRLVAAVIDARRSEVYYSFYRQVPGGVQRLEPPAVGPVGDLVGELLATGEEALLVGDGALRYREQISAGLRRIEFAEQWLAQPSAAPLVQLAHARALREEWVQPGEVQPLYLRRPDAEINWVTRESARRPAS
jgi:tRNA threonylcarbamoyladenosine biosynthesis protein TsaB